MTNNSQGATEKTNLHEKAAEYRLRAVESQLALAFTLCALAETEIRYDQPGEALKLVHKLRHHAENIRIHLDEPDYLPSIAIAGLRSQLIRLENHTGEIESALGQQ